MGLLSFISVALLISQGPLLGFCASADELDLTSIVDLLELDYEDQCVNKAEADWALLLKKPNALEDKLDVDKAFGEFSKSQVEEVKATNSFEYASPALKRKVELVMNPGETLLPSQDWLNFVSFVDTAEYNIEYFNAYTCEKDKPNACTYSNLISTIADSRHLGLLDAAKESWETQLPDEKQFESKILPLLQEVSIASGKSNNIQDYWEMLLEYGGGFDKAEELWEQIFPLYEKLQKYVAKKLEVNTTLVPAHWLGSLFGDDWTSIAKEVVPNPNILQEINKNMQKKQLGGRTAFKSASNLLKHLNLGDLNNIFWRDSRFEQTCPTRMINFCQSGNIKVITCKNISFPLYLDAHDTVMAVKNSEIKASFSANTFILREANRISPLFDAIKGLGSLLAVTPEELSAEVLPNISKNKNAKLNLQFMTALKDLPKLSYYYAADQFRLKLFKSGKPSQISSLWSRTRSEISKLSTSDKDFLGDINIIGNKPYIGQFLGTILKYQVLAALTEDSYEVDENIVRHISQGPKLKKLMKEGYMYPWQNTIRDTLNIKTIDAQELLEYYQPLNDFLTAELGEEPRIISNQDNDDDDDDDDVEDQEDEDEDANIDNDDDDNLVYNSISDSDKKDIPVSSQPPLESKKQDLNVQPIETNQIESSPIENPYLVPKSPEGGSPAASSSEQGDEKLAVQEASALQYAWIALGVLLLIIVILGIIIAKKRYNHRKELEKERRDGSA